MDSAFNLEQQQDQLDSKILVAMERLSESFRVLLWQQAKKLSLSPIQLQVLIFLLTHSENKRTISYLSLEFNLTKPTISDAVKVMARKKLVYKKTHEEDSRSYLINLTSAGKKIAKRVSNFALPIQRAIGSLNKKDKTLMFGKLLQVINQLHQNEIIALQRMCFTCHYLDKKKGGHYCSLLKKPLSTPRLRIDCPEHKLA